ncbi:MAG: thiamine pyrophosphate-dependent dehydrogenase E1 component subunit alpha [Chloroflexi bacterium]|nr:thiamine pyrophosphate-dependent dehydrogenase E1 component subunit alpha [Chloroflexota bacterium]
MTVDHRAAPRLVSEETSAGSRYRLAERLYWSLYRIRRVEEEVARVYPTDKIKSPVHLSIGQEALAVGVCEALEPRDVVFGTYRGHAAYLAKGGDLKAMLAELYGKATGCAGGKAGSMHLLDPEHGVMGMSAVVGTTIPHAAGYAYALKLRKPGAIAVCFLGDGASEEGVFYETLNFAALSELPLLMVVENNGFAIHTPQSARQKNTNIAERAAAFGVTASRLADDDAFGIYAATRDAVDALRLGGGPRLIEIPTYRWKEHVGPGEDFHVGYRSIEDAQSWIERDQVALTGDMLDPETRRAIHDAVDAEIGEAFLFAEASPFPADEALRENVYAN